jgi:hypothetical protein
MGKSEEQKESGMTIDGLHEGWTVEYKTQGPHSPARLRQAFSSP